MHPRQLLLAITALGAAFAADDPAAPRISMTKAVACSKVNGFGDYVPLDEPALTRDDKMLVYYEVRGHEYEMAGKEYRVHLVQDARIRRRGETRILQSKDKMVDYAGRSKTPPLNVYLVNTVSLKSLPPGEYDLELILRDDIGKTPPATQVFPFRVRPSEADPKPPAENAPAPKTKPAGRA